MSRRASALVLILAGVASLTGAAAAPSPPARAGQSAPDVRLTGPIKITAERAELERREYALYRGRVKLVSEDMVLTGDRLELRQPARGEFEARLTGAPARLDHPGDDKNPPVSASAAQIIYDTRSATVDLSGGVQLARGTDQLSSGQVRYNLAARRITASGDASGQVHITIQPPQNDAPPAPPAPTQGPKPK
jgi:lipopolysaccharide export system protein LptA